MATPDWSWQDSAACRGQDLYLFFGKPGEKLHERLIRETKAVAICARCPVMGTCRVAAFERKEETGVWGGLGEDERRSKRRAWQRATSYERRAEAAEVQQVDEKHCPGCDTTQPAEKFPKDRRQSDGLNRVCKACANDAAKQARDRQRSAKAVA